jgi:PAS domain S-box-containing protein
MVEIPRLSRSYARSWFNSARRVAAYAVIALRTGLVGDTSHRRTCLVARILARWHYTPMKRSNSQAITDYDALCARVAELEAEKAEQNALQQNSHALAERVKELRTLYALSRLESAPGVTLPEYLMELVAILPGGWQYVDDTYVRVTFRGQSYATPNCQETAWQQRRSIELYDEPVGMLIVGYLSPHPLADDGPFMAEERSLLEEIANRIGRFVERKEADDAQRRLAAIVEFTENAIYSKTLDGIILSWNTAAERTFGYSAQEMVGQDISRLLTPAQIIEEASLIERLALGYRVGQFEAKRRRKDGQQIDVTLVISPIRDRPGQIVGASTIASDVTERRRVEAILHDSEDRFRATFEQAAVGIAHVGLDGRFLRVNRKLCDTLGYSPAELLACSFQEITFPADLDADLDNVRRMLANECATYRMEKRYLRKDGAIIWADLTVSLARDPGNQPKYFISVVEDISHRKETEDALRRSEARYRGLFENSPISLWEQDFSAVKRRLDALRQAGVTDFRSYLQASASVVAECVALVKLVTFNQASLDLYGAASKDDLMVGLSHLVPPEAHQLFVEELVWIAEGRTSFSWEGINRKLSGEIINVRLHWSAAQGYEDTLDRVLVSIEDITATKRA